MTKLSQDIYDEMKLRFKSDFHLAQELLSDYLVECDYLRFDRIIRCIVYLSNDGIESFRSFLEAAKNDPRDVMWWAEYENNTSLEVTKRVRNFDKSFKEN